MENHDDQSIEHEWNPDCLDRFLGCWKNSPKTTAATGYYLLRIIFSVITVHSAIIFAGVITYAALEVTNCLEGDTDSNSCGKSDDTNNGGECVRLWGLIKPDSLLTVIGTVAAVILALSAAVVGTAMDVTPYRRQIGLMGNIFCMVGMCFCLSLANPTTTTLVVSSIGLVIVVVFKDYVLMQVDSYGPELSKIPAEIGTAVSGAFTWSLIANVLLIVVWSLVGTGTGMSNSTYGFVVTIGSVISLGILSFLTYRRLPDVPASRVVPEGMSIVKFTFHRLGALMWVTYRKYPDLGILLVSGMIFDPALTAILAAAVLIMISKYQFTADQVTIILGAAIAAAIPAVPLSRWLASTRRLSCIFGDADEKAIAFTSAPQDIQVGGLEGTDNYDSVEMIATEDVTEPEDVEGGGSATAVGAGETPAGQTIVAGPTDTKQPVFHPHRVRFFLFIGLVLVIVNTVLVVLLGRACDMGLASLFSCIWGFLMSFCWNNNRMLRMALVPGGRESEYAGLYLAMFSSLVWLPLFIFSVANEVWSIDGALYMLTIFFGVGALLLLFINIDRALATQQNTLSMRRWAHVLMAKKAEKGAPSKPDSATDNGSVAMGEAGK